MTLEHARGDLVAELRGAAAAAEDLATVPGRVRQRTYGWIERSWK